MLSGVTHVVSSFKEGSPFVGAPHTFSGATSTIHKAKIGKAMATIQYVFGG